MLESLYITLTILAFLFWITSFYSQKILYQLIGFTTSTILFSVLAISSMAMEFIVCSTNSCAVSTIYMSRAIWIFGGFSMISGVLAFFKGIETLGYFSGRIK